MSKLYKVKFTIDIVQEIEAESELEAQCKFNEAWTPRDLVECCGTFEYAVEEK